MSVDNLQDSPGSVPRAAPDLHDARAVISSFKLKFEVLRIYPLYGGNTDVYRIDLAGGAEPLVLKLYPDASPRGPAKEALVARWIAEGADVPIQRWLGLDESRTLLPRRFALMTFLPGENVRVWRSSADVALLYRRMGEVLRRLHAIPMAAYGYVEDGGITAPYSTNTSYMEHAFDQSFRGFREHGADRGLARRLQAFVRARLDLLAFSAGPVLCHDDFHQGNVLADRDSLSSPQLTGVIDFGNALAGDPVSDLAKTLFCAGHEDPDSVEPILEGYGAVDHPEAAEALRLYTTYHRLTMWNWLTRRGIALTSEASAKMLTALDTMIRNASEN